MTDPYRMRPIGAGLTEKQLSRLCDAGDVLIRRGEDDPQTFACHRCLDGTRMRLDDKGQAWGGGKCKACTDKAQLDKVRAQYMPAAKEIPV